MALTSSDLDNLDAAIASGELIVQVEGRRVEYRSIDQLLRARQHVAGLLSTATAAATGAGRRHIAFRPVFTTTRGD